MKKYIVTDPCYLMHINPNEDENDTVWREFCSLWFDDKFEDAEALLKNHLKLEYLTICDTGYGDWTNHLYIDSFYTDSGVKIYEQEFFADAGLVCVANCTDEMFNSSGNFISGISGAVFETEQLRDVRFNDNDPDWTVVEIHTKEGSLHTEYPNNDEEDYEDYYEDYEDYEDYDDYYDDYEDYYEDSED